MTLTELEALIAEAIEELNLQLDEEKQIEALPETVLFGRGGKLDSLGLVNLIVLVEEKVFDASGVQVALADERAISQKDSPFRTMRRLAEYIDTLLKEQNDG